MPMVEQVRRIACACTASMLACAGGASARVTLPVLRHAAALHGAVPGTCPAWPQGSGILPDGDFSQAANPGLGILGLPKGNAFAPSWVVTGPKTIDFLGTGNTTWPAPSGVCSVDLDGTPGPGGMLHAPFQTKMGARYTVSFLLSGNGGCGPTVKTLKVSTSDQFAAFTWDTSDGNDGQNGDYAAETWQFTANAATMQLRFQSKDKPPGNCGPLVAAIAVTKTAR